MHKTISCIVLLFVLIPGLVGCQQPQPKTELQFGILAAQKDLWDEAIFRWKKVLQQDPSSAAAYNNLGVAYERKGLWEEAEKAYKAALEMAPGNEYIKSNYEKFQKRLGEKDEDEEQKKKEKKI